MHRILLLLLVLLTLIGCDRNTPQSILDKSIEYHGGKQAWQDQTSISYRKKTQLLKADGSLEKETVFNYTHQWKPEFATLRTQVEQGKVKQVKLTGIASKDSLPFTSQQEYMSAKKDLDAALFVVWQPFTLASQVDQLEYLGEETLEDDTPVFVLKNQYYKADGSKDNAWWFYFNAENGRLEANMVKHGDTYSYIRNNSYEQKTGFSLNKTRTSYRVDSLRNIQFVRARYWYEYQ